MDKIQVAVAIAGPDQESALVQWQQRHRGLPGLQYGGVAETAGREPGLQDFAYSS